MAPILPAADSANYSPSSYRRILQQMGCVLSFTRGISMRPLIWTGRHYVAIAPVDGEPQIGDILLFEQMRNGETACILHRLVEIEDNPTKIYITRGDNCLGVERILRDDIIGRVVVIYRSAGFRPWFALRSKEIHMTDTAYLRYVRFWNAVWPLRRTIYRARAAFATSLLWQKCLRPCYHRLKD